ncbi:MFS general substrate transporter [Obba rivulosa]|uniref:MFS general substrate transporter n=1 Tax=Obba rivulosa TaxID=1052685 RepID=A0A8E2ANP2_9APHY|nr:MFS general substrate transporter [Obba rivulosa]
MTRHEDYVELVVFAPDDPDDPKNWSRTKKLSTMATLCFLVFCAVFGSSVYAPGQDLIRQRYGVSADVASVGLTLYVLGFGFAPLLCPLSEMYGRKRPLMVSWILLLATTVPSAFVDNIVVILVFRFFTGCAAASALNSGPGVLTDLWPNDFHTLGRSTAFSALSGPCFGSLVGFFVAAHSGQNLWVLRVHLFFSIACWPLVFLLPETYTPTILTYRARRLRKQGNPHARAPVELHTKSTMQILKGHIGRPIAMLAYEPIVQGAALWITITYGILYFFFEVYPIVFIQQHGIPFQLCGLMFLGVSLGMVIAITVHPYLVRLSEHIPLPGVEQNLAAGHPEETHLKVVLLACVALPVSLFWFAWTSESGTTWVSPALAGVVFGYSNLTLFFCFISYTSQTYSIYASSAAAANTLFRSVVASIFPIVAQSIVNRLGTTWGVTIFALIACLLLPIPLVFIRYGASLRARSPLAQEARELRERMHQQVAEKETVDGIESTEGTEVRHGDLEEGPSSKEVDGALVIISG